MSPRSYQVEGSRNSILVPISCLRRPKPSTDHRIQWSWRGCIRSERRDGSAQSRLGHHQCPLRQHARISTSILGGRNSSNQASSKHPMTLSRSQVTEPRDKPLSDITINLKPLSRRSHVLLRIVHMNGPNQPRISGAHPPAGVAPKRLRETRRFWGNYMQGQVAERKVSPRCTRRR